MTEFALLTLGEELEVLLDHRGRTPKKLGSDWIDSGVQVISAKLVRDGRLDLGREQRYVSHDVYERWMPSRLAPGDIILTSEAPLGESAVVGEESTLCLGQRLFGLRPNAERLDPLFLFYWLRSQHGRAALERRASGTTVRGIRQAELVKVEVPAPSVETQRSIGLVLRAIDDLIDNNRRRVEVLEEMARALYREWFIHFRFPGHEDAAFVDSDLGSIPSGWEVASVESLGATEKWAITGGPFGSKLGRKDYVDSGVPVLRGANLAVGGGFDESDLVFVSLEKAHELRSCWTVPGDVVITQRGTLGQIGLIPDSSRYDVYVLSQSQMKVTLDESKLSHVVFYEQMRTTETTERFIARAMTAGVPHLNLGLLREFEVLVPAPEMQQRFGEAVLPLHSMQRSLLDQADRLEAVRDLLLPKLVTGAIDVSKLDLDRILEEAAL